MDVVFQIIFFCLTSFIALWSGMVIVISFISGNMENNTRYGEIFFANYFVMAIAAGTAIYHKTYNVTITVFSLVICLFIIVPIIITYFRVKKRYQQKAKQS